jgi:hypothetical protein
LCSVHLIVMLIYNIKMFISIQSKKYPQPHEYYVVRRKIHQYKA